MTQTALPTDMLTTREAAKLLGGIKPYSVTVACERGTISGAVRSPNGTWRIPYASVLAYRQPPPGFLSVDQVAAALNLEPPTVAKRCRDGHIQGATRTSHRWLIPTSALDAFRTHQQSPPPPPDSDTLTTAEAAATLDIDKSRVTRYCRNGTFTGAILDPAKGWLIPADVVLSFQPAPAGRPKKAQQS